MTIIRPIPVESEPAPQMVGVPGRLILAEALRPERAMAQKLRPAICGTAAVATIEGPVAAAALTAGMKVLTRDNGYAEVLAVAHGDENLIAVAPGALGNDAEVLLPVRAGVVISGTSFEALFGVREVIVPLSALVDGVAIRPVPHLARQVVVTIELDQGEILWADGMSVAAGDPDDPARPVLMGREAAVAARLAGFGASSQIDAA